MKRYILTVGPSLLHKTALNKIHQTEFIYRINGAHGSLADIEGYIAEIRRQVVTADILLDLPGNKVRTKGIELRIEAGQEFSVPAGAFNYADFYKLLKPGMKVWANDSTLEFEVIDATADRIVFLSKSTGQLVENKGVHVRGIHAELPFLFEKDLELIDLANKHGLAFVGLSFVRTRKDVETARKLIEGSEIICKVETLAAVKDLNNILAAAEYFLIDRGDLSTDIGIENVPRYQNYIIDKAKYFDRKVFLATQILKNMENRPIPTIAEIDDLYNISKQGVYGIQLSEETAIGAYVEECIAVLYRTQNCVVNENIIA